MTVELLHHTPLWVCSTAIRKCWASEDKSDTYKDKAYPFGSGEIVCGEKDKALIHRIGNQNKHSSTLEHLVYNYDIAGISRACLQELARHRMASYSVKSTRYTLKELKEDTGDFYSEDEERVDIDKLQEWCVIGDKFQFRHILRIAKAITELREAIQNSYGATNDQIKYMIPEAYKTSLVMTINARSLQNFLALRTSKHALWEIRDLANEMYNKLPEDHKYLFTDFISKE